MNKTNKKVRLYSQPEEANEARIAAEQQTSRAADEQSGSRKRESKQSYCQYREMVSRRRIEERRRIERLYKKIYELVRRSSCLASTAESP